MSELDIVLSDAQKRAVSIAAEQCYDILRHEVGDSKAMEIELLRLARDSFRAGLSASHAEIARQRDVMRNLNGQCDHLGIRLGDVIAERDRLRAELAAIHAIVMSIGDAPEPSLSDPYTVREVKRMASLIRSLSEERDRLRAQVGTAIEVIQRGVAIMETEQVGQWAGVRTFLEQDSSYYYTPAEEADALRAELAEARRDAERYRKLLEPFADISVAALDIPDRTGYASRRNGSHVTFGDIRAATAALRGEGETSKRRKT